MKTETEYKHTPAPWYISTRGSHIVTSNDPMEQSVICSLHGDYRTDEIAGNAELIVLAPSLLQERDTLKSENERQRTYIDKQKVIMIQQNHEMAEIEAHYSSVGMGLYPKEIYKERDGLREANKELIEALETVSHEFYTLMSHCVDQDFIDPEDKTDGYIDYENAINKSTEVLQKHRKE